MGSSFSHADASPRTHLPPPVAAPSGVAPPSAPPPPAVEKPREPVNYLNLPTPVKYEEIQRESTMSLRWESFEGCRFDFTKPLNQHFHLNHSIVMGPVEVPAQQGQIIKVPTATYEFGATLVDAKYLLIGRMMQDGRMTGRAKYDVNDFLTFKLNAQLTNEQHFSQAMVDADFKGHDWQGQIKLGNSAFYGVNYIQSVHPNFAVGGEGFWLGHQRKSGFGFAARHQTDKAISVAQVASTGLVSLSYCQRVGEKVSLASELVWNWNSGEATTTVGYDYILRQCRLRGRVDSNGVVAGFLEERLNVGLTFLLSAELDHWNKNYKFGFGMTVGE